MTKRLFLARPSYGPREPEGDFAARRCVFDQERIYVAEAAFGLSMTCKNMNDHLVACLNDGSFDYYALQHADVAPEAGWAETLIDRLEAADLDLIHAPCAFKNDTGITSTAIGYSDNLWAPVRRITTTELRDLPETFDIETLRAVYDPDAERMLFNTGCMVVKLDEWIEDFTGFTMADRIFKHAGKWHSLAVSEDYMFAHWCHNNGVRAGGTKIVTGHWGRKNYTTAEAWGAEHDEQYYREMAEIREAQVA